MLSDMIASVKKAEADAAAMIAESEAAARNIRAEAEEKAADMIKNTLEKAKAAAAKTLFDREEQENALDEQAAARTERDADALRKQAQKHSNTLTDKLKELMFA